VAILLNTFRCPCDLTKPAVHSSVESIIMIAPGIEEDAKLLRGGGKTEGEKTEGE